STPIVYGKSQYSFLLGFRIALHVAKGILNRRFKRRFGDFAAVGKVTRAGARNTSILAPEGETLLAPAPQRKRSFAALRMILAPRRSFVDSTAKVW
ncbi:MAG: hypothetical protein IIT47_04710, partial [Oscillospiraceae bacterium]|nr:hypothetical protein [Oscillospiraceae bacterium]